MNTQTLEAQEVESSTALVRHTEPQQQPCITPAQAKTDAIAALTMKAYDRASQLSLSPDEVKNLSADFPDEAFKPGAAGKENLIYIEHAYLRDRFNQVFGMGQWAIVPRNRWAEEFLTSKGDPGTRIYVEAMLLVRGCFVGEAVGSMEYYPKNASQDYGDAVEGAKTAAFRRCAKELGVGLQAWKKDWCESWWQRKRSGTRNSNTRGLNTLDQSAKSASVPGASQKDTRVASEPPISRQATNTARTEADATARTAKPVGTAATPAQRDKMIAELIEFEDQKAILEWAQKAGILMPVETLLDWPLRFVPVTKKQMDLLKAAIADFFEGGEAVKPFVNPEPVEVKPETGHRGLGAGGMAPPADEAWKLFPVPYGPNKGVPLGQLAKENPRKVYGFWANVKVEETYTDKTTGETRRSSPANMAATKLFRIALDAAGAHMEFTKKGGDE